MSAKQKKRAQSLVQQDADSRIMRVGYAWTVISHPARSAVLFKKILSKQAGHAARVIFLLAFVARPVHRKASTMCH